MASELYRPPVARLIIVGEAPPPARFFYWGDSLFLRHLRRVFIALLPQVETEDAGWFLAFCRALGVWRTDVCAAPQRASKGGADDVAPCLSEFLRRWQGQAIAPDAVVVVSPKRLTPRLPDGVREMVTLSVAPPGQWNAHREAFARDMTALITREWGRAGLREVAQTVQTDDAALDFAVARACAEGMATEELRGLVRGHERERELWAAFEAGSSAEKG